MKQCIPITATRSAFYPQISAGSFRPQNTILHHTVWQSFCENTMQVFFENYTHRTHENKRNKTKSVSQYFIAERFTLITRTLLLMPCSLTPMFCPTYYRGLLGWGQLNPASPQMTPLWIYAASASASPSSEAGTSVFVSLRLLLLSRNLCRRIRPSYKRRS